MGQHLSGAYDANTCFICAGRGFQLRFDVDDLGLWSQRGGVLATPIVAPGRNTESISATGGADPDDRSRRRTGMRPSLLAMVSGTIICAARIGGLGQQTSAGQGQGGCFDTGDFTSGRQGFFSGPHQNVVNKRLIRTMGKSSHSSYLVDFLKNCCLLSRRTSLVGEAHDQGLANRLN